ncbi:MAG: hypothetical protein ACLVEJ_14890 [Parabacteroides sp.]
MSIDFNKASIDYASQRRKDIRYIQDDYILHYPAADGMKCPMRSRIDLLCYVGTHSDEERDTVTRRIFDSLTEGGETPISRMFSPKRLSKDKAGKKESWECRSIRRLLGMASKYLLLKPDIPSSQKEK